MYCQQCGSENPDGAAFCQNCGAKMAAPGAPVAPSRSVPPPRPRATGVYPTVSLGPIQIPQSFVEFSQILLPIGATFMFLGTFLPWMRAVSLAGYGADSVSGFNAVVHRLGIVTMILALAIGAGYAALRLLPPAQTTARYVRLGAVIALGIVLLCVMGIGISVGSDVREWQQQSIARVSVGFGFHLTWLGTLVACAGGLWVWLRD
jgi:hypothetical protein